MPNPNEIYTSRTSVFHYSWVCAHPARGEERRRKKKEEERRKIEKGTEFWFKFKLGPGATFFHFWEGEEGRGVEGRRGEGKSKDEHIARIIATQFLLFLFSAFLQLILRYN